MKKKTFIAYSIISVILIIIIILVSVFATSASVRHQQQLKNDIYNSTTSSKTMNYLSTTHNIQSPSSEQSSTSDSIDNIGQLNSWINKGVSISETPNQSGLYLTNDNVQTVASNIWVSSPLVNTLLKLDAQFNGGINYSLPNTGIGNGWNASFLSVIRSQNFNAYKAYENMNYSFTQEFGTINYTYYYVGVNSSQQKSWQSGTNFIQTPRTWLDYYVYMNMNWETPWNNLYNDLQSKVSSYSNTNVSNYVVPYYIEGVTQFVNETLNPELNDATSTRQAASSEYQDFVNQMEELNQPLNTTPIPNLSISNFTSNTTNPEHGTGKTTYTDNNNYTNTYLFAPGSFTNWFQTFTSDGLSAIPSSNTNSPTQNIIVFLSAGASAVQQQVNQFNPASPNGEVVDNGTTYYSAYSFQKYVSINDPDYTSAVQANTGIIPLTSIIKNNKVSLLQAISNGIPGLVSWFGNELYSSPYDTSEFGSRYIESYPTEGAAGNPFQNLGIFLTEDGGLLKTMINTITNELNSPNSLLTTKETTTSFIPQGEENGIASIPTYGNANTYLVNGNPSINDFGSWLLFVQDYSILLYPEFNSMWNQTLSNIISFLNITANPTPNMSLINKLIS